MHNEGRATAKNCMQYKYDMQGGGARRRREARGGDPATRARTGAGKGVGITPGTPWHQRVRVSGGPDIESVESGRKAQAAYGAAVSASVLCRTAAVASICAAAGRVAQQRRRMDLAFSR